MRPNSLLQNFWKHRRLLWQFTLRNIELRHKGSHLGLIWSFLNPLLMLGLYVLVFGFIFDGRFRRETAPETRIEYALVVFLGLALHHFIAEIVTGAPVLITGNPNFVKKVVFPLEILPASNVGAAFSHLLITLGLVFTGAVVCGAPLTWGVLWLPLLLIPLLLIAIGSSLGLAAIGVFWRDVGQVMQFSVLALLFASAVFYPISKIPPAAWGVLRYNPLLLAIDEARGTAFWGRPLNFLHLGYLYIFGICAYWGGANVFRRLRASFADVL